MILALIVIIVALIFEYINGFHDTANSIATVVGTKALNPTQAVTLAALTNLLGALWGTKVALTITLGLVDANVVTMTSKLILCALLGGIAWNLLTWWFGLPSSSSHALIGGLCGSGVAAAGSWKAIIWSQPHPDHWWLGKGLLWRVLVPMVASPLAGYLLGLLFMVVLYVLLQRQRPMQVNKFFSRAQIVSAGAMGFMHGTNDAQKTMGIIALVLLGATKAGDFDKLPAALHFLYTPAPAAGGTMHIAVWIKVVCAIAMAAGTAVGGWRIIRTLGHKVAKLQPIHGFAAQATSSAVIAAASVYGIPVSTTHNVSASIMGVGSAKRLNAVNFSVMERMVWAWILTTPAAGLVAYVAARLIGP